MQPANHLDTRLRLTPRDYCAVGPHEFGHNETAEFVVPAGGNATSARIARVQHLLVCRWRAQGQRPSGAWLGRRWGFSRQVFSRSMLGERWAGNNVFAALVYATSFASHAAVGPSAPPPQGLPQPSVRAHRESPSTAVRPDTT
ncbi:hypothetical protein ER308_08805 [Egibacter rhizosphaerae]|uniref:Uncharacterized protein n=1 Tax=Egibacter rhizosphaerae TaxID=1670831 RepID=A0A411YEL6_9ACTN|nr:hypothetical protein [Egibacter rhizosphaerae]QBI19640.1 hypothetical protein ER308_08805 [Egibacter rhizosphaerae]